MNVLITSFEKLLKEITLDIFVCGGALRPVGLHLITAKLKQPTQFSVGPAHEDDDSQSPFRLIR